jgi:hypothetical protein
MDWRGVWRAGGAPCWRLSGRVAAITALAVTVSGCVTGADSGARIALNNGLTGATVAFESIDGPPPAVFSRMVATLNDEAAAQRLNVVSRAGPATYRVRAYVSAVVNRGKTSFVWVWDVYDAERQRALRVAGEEPAAAGRHRDAWAAADEQVVRRMARSGVERVAAFLSEPRAGGIAIASGPGLLTFALARDDTPEAAGIVARPGAAPAP